MMHKTKGFGEQDTIIASLTGKPIAFEAMINELKEIRILYVGEIHSEAAHHAIQLKIIKALFQTSPDLSVGMEMFDHTYQNILDQWSSGLLDQHTFLKKVHWYANWKFDFELYQDILLFIRDNRISLIGLNIPFDIPSKIAVGGIENLSEADRKHLPQSIDTTNAAHRVYVENIFKHHQIKGRDNFEDFYMTQCVWEDAMAEAVSNHLKDRMMVVIAGNGHILQKFGIPDRAYKRTNASYKTILLVPQQSSCEISHADYIWITQ